MKKLLNKNEEEFNNQVVMMKVLLGATKVMPKIKLTNNNAFITFKNIQGFM